MKTKTTLAICLSSNGLCIMGTIFASIFYHKHPEFSVILGVMNFLAFLEAFIIIPYCLMPSPLDKSHNRSNKLHEQPKVQAIDATELDLISSAIAQIDVTQVMS
jgi:hypothetical protein